MTIIDNPECSLAHASRRVFYLRVAYLLVFFWADSWEFVSACGTNDWGSKKQARLFGDLPLCADDLTLTPSRLHIQ
ncbi:hypothetical protein PCAR4_390007 [Paraburkholderia caribensis]|nr:hypothetical protein PCAR4_390007 [Paraburkholderia caribensis]